MDITWQDLLELLEETYPLWKLDQLVLQQLSRHVTTRVISTGQYLYRQGKKSNRLYIVFSGKIKLSRINGSKRIDIATYSRGEWIGLEAAGRNKERLTHAIAVQETILICLDVEGLSIIYDHDPQLRNSLSILFDSLHLRIMSGFNWLKQDERVFYMARRHPAYLIIRLTPALIITIPLVLFFRWIFMSSLGDAASWLLLGVVVVAWLTWVIWHVLDWLNDKSIITNERIVFQEKILLLYDSRLESPLNQILSISTETGQLGRWLLYGDVIVRTYTSRVKLPGVAYPGWVADFLEWSRMRSHARLAHLPANEMEEELLKRLGLAESFNKTSHIDFPSLPGEFQEQFSDRINHLFQIRYEKGETIVYRKHWYILFKKAILPAGLLFLVNFVLLAHLLNLMSLLSTRAILGITLLGDIILGAWLIYEYLDWTNDIYIISKDQLIDVNKKPLGREERKEAPIKNILSIDFVRLGFIGLLLNFGTVYIRVGDSDLTFDYVYDPSDVQRELFSRLAQQINWNQWELLDDNEKHVADWIVTYHRIMGKGH